jgi:excisionase family DNA binding protein
MTKDYLMISEVAKELGVHRDTIRRWIHKGFIKATKTFGNHFRISADELEKVRTELSNK